MGYLPPPPSSIASTCYMVGGMPLAFTQEDFLVSQVSVCPQEGVPLINGLCFLVLSWGIGGRGGSRDSDPMSFPGGDGSTPTRSYERVPPPRTDQRQGYPSLQTTSRTMLGVPPPPSPGQDQDRGTPSPCP